MKIIEIIESKHWYNIKTGRTASIYGSAPWTNDSLKNDWEVRSRGYTWRLDNGTIGLGRQPAATHNEALEVMRSFNNRF